MINILCKLMQPNLVFTLNQGFGSITFNPVDPDYLDPCLYGLAQMCRRWNIAQLWSFFWYILGRILKISFWNYVSSLLSMHFTLFYFYRSSWFSQKLEPFIQNYNLCQQVMIHIHVKFFFLDIRTKTTTNVLLLQVS